MLARAISASVHHCIRPLSTAAISSCFRKGSALPEPVKPIRIRGRSGIPMSEDKTFPEYMACATPGSPLVLTPIIEGHEDMDLDDWAKAAKAEIEHHLTKYGAIYFTSIPDLKTPQDLATLMRSTKLSDVVRTASDEPPEYAIEPHSEYHTAGLPHKIALFAHGEVPTYGGEWMVADTRRIMEELNKAVVKKFDELGACYRVFYESKDNSVVGYNNWQTNISYDKEKVEEYLKIRGYDWKWNADDSLEYWKVYPAIVPHPVTGERCWFNQIHAQHKSFYYSHPRFRDMPRDSNRFPVNTTYGDGTEIEPERLSRTGASSSIMFGKLRRPPIPEPLGNSTGVRLRVPPTQYANDVGRFTRTDSRDHYQDIGLMNTLQLETFIGDLGHRQKREKDGMKVFKEWSRVLARMKELGPAVSAVSTVRLVKHLSVGSRDLPPVEELIQALEACLLCQDHLEYSQQWFSLGTVSRFSLHLAKLCSSSSSYSKDDRKRLLRCSTVDRIGHIIEVKIREHMSTARGDKVVLKPRVVSKLCLAMALLERYSDMEAWRGLMLVITSCVRDMDQEHVQHCSYAIYRLLSQMIDGSSGVVDKMIAEEGVEVNAKLANQARALLPMAKHPRNLINILVAFLRWSIVGQTRDVQLLVDASRRIIAAAGDDLDSIFAECSAMDILRVSTVLLPHEELGELMKSLLRKAWQQAVERGPRPPDSAVRKAESILEMNCGITMHAVSEGVDVSCLASFELTCCGVGICSSVLVLLMDRRRAVRKRVEYLCKVIRRSSKDIRKDKKGEETSITATLDVETFLKGLNELEPFSATEVYCSDSGCKVYVGGLDDACQFEDLKQRNVGTVINCAGAQCALARLQADVIGGSNPYKGIRFDGGCYREKLGAYVEYLSIAAEDATRYPIDKHFKEVSECLDKVMSVGEHSVLIHCMQGYNRSCALLCSWLCGGLNGPRLSLCEAVELIASRREYVLSNRGFLAKLVEAYWPPDDIEIKSSIGPCVNLYEQISEAPLNLIGEVKECVAADPATTDGPSIVKLVIVEDMSVLKVFEPAPDATGFDPSKPVSLHNMIPAPHDSPALISRQQKLYDQEAMVFIITRNKNDNTVCYRAKFSSPGVLNKDEPIEAYWMDFVKYKDPEMNEQKCRSDLIWIEKKMAYGISATPTDKANRYKLHLVALPSRDVYLVVDKDGRPRAETEYKGKTVYLLRIYVEAKENMIGVPTVRWVNVHCLDPETGREFFYMAIGRLHHPSGMTTRSSSPAVPRGGYRVVEVSGRPFAIEASWLRPYESSKLYDTIFNQPADESGVVDIVSDTVLFGIVVDWLRTGMVQVPPEIREEDVEAEFEWFRFLGLPYPPSTSVCREPLDLETMRYALKDMVQRATDEADAYCKENNEVDSELVVLVIVREVVERAVTTSHWVGISMADLPKRLWEVLHSVTPEASEVIADRISDTLSTDYGLKVKSVKLDFRPFEEVPEASSQCDCCGCEVGDDSNWNETPSADEEEAVRSRDRCDRRSIEAYQRDRFNVTAPFEETMDCAPRLGRGGIFHARIRTTEAFMLRAVKYEARLKQYAINKHNRRFRSWAQQRVRQYRLATVIWDEGDIQAVTVTTDPGLMDAPYLAAAIQKAASLRKHDVKLWRGFTVRLMEILDQIPPEHIGYVLWGYGKALYLPPNAKEVYLKLFDRVRELLPQLSSHAIMATLWAMKRVQIQPVVIYHSPQHKSDLMEFAKHVMERRDSIRPTDFCKIANCLAFFGTGKHNSGFRKQFSEVAQSKYDEELFAQGFRAVVSPIAIYNLWNDSMRGYVLERRIQQTARPNHLHAAYLSAVICRVHHSKVWFDLSVPCRQFYTRLSMRHIPYGNIKPSPLHQDVSNHLAELQVTHRNSFRWGPFAIDIGIESNEVHGTEDFGDDRKKCIFIDGPSQFYFGTNEYLESVKMYHSTLSSLGWMVYRVHWSEWAKTYDIEGGGKEDRLNILKKIIDSDTASGNIDTVIDRAFSLSILSKNLLGHCHSCLGTYAAREREASSHFALRQDLRICNRSLCVAVSVAMQMIVSSQTPSSMERPEILTDETLRGLSRWLKAQMAEKASKPVQDIDFAL
ncbi:hypothetical protein FOL47_003319 [Perkinsus chesapeaki]|uniref:Uncharacterized protein n=1 Tax=Perkinsus chesapeaki TaxID=330153 RepID=A0A7J6N247_PERCH|nr:hypothetical protein FOL47_003319 [Perkinsus chesapeaki]